MPQMVQHSQEEYDVEPAESGRRQLVEIENPVIDLGPQTAVDLKKSRNFHTVDRGDVRAVTLSLETEPAVPGADIENAFAAEVGGNRIAGVALLLHRQRHVSVDGGAVREFEAVIPAFGEQVLAEIQSPGGCRSGFRGVFGHLNSHSLTCGIGSASGRRSASARASPPGTPPGIRVRPSAFARRVFA